MCVELFVYLLVVLAYLYFYCYQPTISGELKTVNIKVPEVNYRVEI